MNYWLPEVARRFDIEQRRGTETSDLYTKAMDDILVQQTNKYAHINRFLENVNQFMIDKELVIRRKQNDTNRPEVGIQREGDSDLIDIETMSSGERQILSLLHAASFLGENDLVLIDEPEISLHIDWQYKLPRAMADILDDKQLIVCTHSPEIFSGFERIEGSHLIELDPVSRS